MVLSAVHQHRLLPDPDVWLQSQELALLRSRTTVCRYAVRRDVANVQLKGGVVAAFGLVRGLAQAEEILRRSAAGSPTVPLEVMGGAAVAAGESMLVIGFAAAAMELAFRKGFVRTFGGDA